MVDLYEGPSREGTRGGLEQFTWDSVKGQVFKDRECYLGQSVRVGVQGKFGRFSTNDWWIRKREDPTKISEEQDVVKRFEEELMQEALGVKPKRLLLIKGELSEDQKRELLELDAEGENDDEKKPTAAPQNKTSRSERSGSSSSLESSSSLKKLNMRNEIYQDRRHRVIDRKRKSSLERDIRISRHVKRHRRT